MNRRELARPGGLTKVHMERPVALLDSDGGGLRLLAELTRRLPAEDYVYLADSARGPYGRATVAEARLWTEQGAYFLLRFDPKVLALASHTMGALAGERLRKSFPVPVFSPCGLLARRLVEPGAYEVGAGGVPGLPGLPAGRGAGPGVVALLASDTSLASGFYQEALAKARASAVPCPASELTEALADGAAEGERGKPGAAARLAALVEKALAPALAAEPRVEAVLLAESALELVAPFVRQLLGSEVLVVSVLAQLAGEVERLLTLAGTLRPPAGEGLRYFLASGDVERFRERGAALYGAALGRVVAASPGRFFEQIGTLGSPQPASG